MKAPCSLSLYSAIFIIADFAYIHAFSPQSISSAHNKRNNPSANPIHLQASIDPAKDPLLSPPSSPSESSSPTIPPQSTQKKKDLKTFARYLEIESWKRGPNARDLEQVLRSIGEACKQINRIVQRAQTDDLYGVAVNADGEQLSDNVQGEVQQKLDVVCNNIMLKQFCGSSKGVIAAVASEEEDKPRTCCDVMVRENLII